MVVLQILTGLRRDSSPLPLNSIRGRSFSRSHGLAVTAKFRTGEPVHQEAAGGALEAPQKKKESVPMALYFSSPSAPCCSLLSFRCFQTGNFTMRPRFAFHTFGKENRTPGDK